MIYSKKLLLFQY